ncbi:MAG: 50S ribosome-binding GTPase [Candidatus Heimdallarchaeota archaeon]|nr:50S ribosome-binding GTPase [Candidatus Heimdallarchaeota archaeon]MCK5047929.1 50S ribosome-binding GTPase [Candidatus Heimdallarchaeota archaeon]
MAREEIYIPDVTEDKELIIFLGRPNSGKSSWINIIFGIKRVKGKMAGSTKKIAVLNVPNHPKLNIVDVPGWGRVAGKSRQFASDIKDQIIEFIDAYSTQIKLAVLVIDLYSYKDVSERMSKKGFIPLDIEFAELLNKKGINFIILANKKDRFTSHHLDTNVDYLKESIIYTEPIFIQPCSAKNPDSTRKTREIVNSYIFS